MIDDEIGRIIEAYGPSEVLRAITRFARDRAEKMCRENYGRAMAIAENGGLLADANHEPPEAERYSRDMALAWACLDADYLAKQFEDRIALAGMSNAERCAHDKQQKIRELKRELDRVEAVNCA